MNPDLTPIHFYDHPIQVVFDTPPVRRKVPPCPDGFTWQEQNWRVEEKLAEWVDFSRHGRMKRNMSPAHAAVASGRGSLGVGRFYFRVKARLIRPGKSRKRDTEPLPRIFDIYYDREIKSADDRLGDWMLYRELAPAPKPKNLHRPPPR
jgi:Domain of unknown function (DUF6504)